MRKTTIIIIAAIAFFGEVLSAHESNAGQPRSDPGQNQSLLDVSGFGQALSSENLSALPDRQAVSFSNSDVMSSSADTNSSQNNKSLSIGDNCLSTRFSTVPPETSEPVDPVKPEVLTQLSILPSETAAPVEPVKPDVFTQSSIIFPEASAPVDPVKSEVLTLVSIVTSEASAPVDTIKPAIFPLSKPATEKMSIPTNEQLAFQITEMRLRILGMERNIKKVNRDIKKIKVILARRSVKAKKSSK